MEGGILPVSVLLGWVPKHTRITKVTIDWSLWGPALKGVDCGAPGLHTSGCKCRRTSSVAWYIVQCYARGREGRIGKEEKEKKEKNYRERTKNMLCSISAKTQHSGSSLPFSGLSQLPLSSNIHLSVHSRKVPANTSSRASITYPGNDLPQAQGGTARKMPTTMYLIRKGRPYFSTSITQALLKRTAGCIAKLVTTPWQRCKFRCF